MLCLKFKPPLSKIMARTWHSKIYLFFHLSDDEIRSVEGTQWLWATQGCHHGSGWLRYVHQTTRALVHVFGNEMFLFKFDFAQMAFQASVNSAIASSGFSENFFVNFLVDFSVTWSEFFSGLSWFFWRSALPRHLDLHGVGKKSIKKSIKKFTNGFSPETTCEYRD